MSQILIVNATIVTMDSHRLVLEGGSLLIDSDYLAAVGAATPEIRPEMEVIDHTGQNHPPGLHQHPRTHEAFSIQEDDLRCWHGQAERPIRV